MTKTVIKVNDNGPYDISGSFKIIDHEGNSFSEEGNVSLCRCGKSQNKPFCDGTHDKVNFQSKPRAHKIMVEV